MIDPFNAHDDEPRWLCWRQEIRADKPTKVPYSARTGRYASATDPLTWSNRLTAEGYIFQNLKLSSETLRPQSSAAPAHAHPCRAGHCTGKLDLVHKSLLLAALRRKFRDSFARGGISKISDRRRDGIAQSIFYVCVSRKPARMGLAMPRRPKPVDLHHLEGTYQRVRHDRRAVEPEAPADLAELRAPKWLTERQRAIWADVVKRAPRGILRAIASSSPLIANLSTGTSAPPRPRPDSMPARGCHCWSRAPPG